MPNWSPYGSVAHARYHLACPICKKSKGHVRITEHAHSVDTWNASVRLECKDCGLLGQTSEIEWDWSVPTGVSSREHGLSAAEVLAVWLIDHPPSAIDQLARIGRSGGRT